SDHFSFAKRGVPAISFGSGNDWVDGGVKAGNAATEEYTARHYHQPSDEWQASWPFTGMARDLQLLYTVGSQLANSDQWPGWSPRPTSASRLSMFAAIAGHDAGNGNSRRHSRQGGNPSDPRSESPPPSFRRRPESHFNSEACHHT